MTLSTIEDVDAKSDISLQVNIQLICITCTILFRQQSKFACVPFYLETRKPMLITKQNLL